jgi:DNA-binding LytR/AlgR family response regulator
LTDYITSYAAAHGEEFDLVPFSDGLDIAEEYTTPFDIIFMDIEMAHLNGMEAAKRIRAHDRNVIIIFITNVAEYAIQGYQVEAMDYVLKPISAFAFEQELHKAVQRVQERHSCYLHILREGSMVRLDSADITYIESGQGHQVLYHTTRETVVGRESMKNLEAKLAAQHFSRCNSCYLVNLAYVERVDNGIAVVAGNHLQISRLKKKNFMDDLARYIGGE